MGLLDNNINVVVFSDAPPVTSQGFGTPLFLAAPGTLGAGFTERVRYYTSVTAVAADLASGDLSAVAAAALNIGLQQNPRSSRIGCGRIETLVAGVQTITITYGADGDQYSATISVLGQSIEGSYTAVALDDADAVAAALEASLQADLTAKFPVSPPISLGVALNVITITGLDTSAGFSTTTAVVGTGTAVVATTTPPVSPSSEMDLLFAETGDWYGFTGDPAAYSDTAIVSLAGWAQSNERLFIPQSDTTDIKDSTTGHVGEDLKDLSYDYTGLLYHHSDAEYAALAWLSFTLATDLDNETTAWFYKTLTGITISPLTTTERNNLQANSVNFVQTFFGQTSTWKGTVANGDYIDIRTTKDWAAARIAEALAQTFLDTYNRNSKIPYTDQGIQGLASRVDSVLLNGIVAGHFLEGSNNVTAPRAADVPLADKQARRLSLEFSATVTGAIGEVDVTGYVTLQTS